MIRIILLLVTSMFDIPYVFPQAIQEILRRNEEDLVRDLVVDDKLLLEMHLSGVCTDRMEEEIKVC